MMKKHLLTWLPFVILAVGLALLLYPTLSDWWNTKHESQAVAGYIRHVANLSRTENEQMLEQARAYNKTLIGRGSDRFEMSAAEEKEYDSLLDVTGTGIMGYVDIPKINIKLPIYHGVDESVLQVAIGHIPGSSLPVGGEGTHTVISGHRGLPSARLFTDIDKLSVGDSFYIQVLDETLTYEVDQIRTVLPDELQNLTIDPKEDYCTLVTCTPYGVSARAPCGKCKERCQGRGGRGAGRHGHRGMDCRRRADRHLVYCKHDQGRKAEEETKLILISERLRRRQILPMKIKKDN